MRIGIDARYIQDQYHGIGRYTFQLVRAMLQAESNHTFFIFYSDRYPNSRFDLSELWASPNARPYRFHSALYHPAEQREFRRAAQDLRLDLFHTPYLSAPWFQRYPLVVTVHDLIFERYPQYIPARQSRAGVNLVYRTLLSSLVKRASRVIVPSRATARDLGEFYPQVRGKIRVIPEGVELAFRPVTDLLQLAAVRTKYGLPAHFILSLGTRRPHKNIEQLIAAFASLHHETELDLVLAGEADHRFPDSSLELAERWQIRHRVHTPGSIAEADLPALYSAAQVFVFPSQIEGFGLPILEAMACGTPVIASNASALPEVAGTAARLVDPDDVMALAAALRASFDLLNRCIRPYPDGLTQAVRFSWEQTARATLNIYEEAGG